MKVKKAVLITSAAVLVVVLLGCLYGYKYISDSKDYMRYLAKPGTSPAVNTQDRTGGQPEKVPEGIPASSERDSSGDDTSDISSELPSAENRINLLLLGLDRTEERDETMGGAYRTDAISIVSIDLVTKETRVLCIPRDSYVYIPCIGGKDKINHAYVWGGMNESGVKSTIDTVDNLIRYSRVDYYFVMDMEPVADIVDELGGVEVDVEIDMKDHGADLSKGMQLLNGKQAFDYIHWRYSANGDIDRIKRQQKFLKAVFDKLKSPGQWTNAAKIVLKYNNNIKTNMTTRQIIALAALGSEIQEQGVTFEMLPGDFGTIDGISYWIPDEEKCDAVLREIFGE